jgi:hypothetical protein
MTPICACHSPHLFQSLHPLSRYPTQTLTRFNTKTKTIELKAKPSADSQGKSSFTFPKIPHIE